MKRPTLKRLLHVFGDDGAETVTVDRLKLRVTPTHGYVAREAVPEAHLGHVERVLSEQRRARLARAGQHRCLMWKESEPIVSVEQHVGDRPPGYRRRSVSQVVFANPSSALAQRYEMQGLMPRRLPKDPKNVVYPFIVAPHVVSAAALSFVVELARSRVDAYSDVYELLFGQILPRDQVRVSVNEIELTWDRTCDAAGYAPTAFCRPWAQRMRKACFHFEGAYLTAEVAEGERHKLYAKTPRVLRYEICLSQDRIRDLLGHSLNPLEGEVFENDVRELAARLYPRILDIQEHVLPKLAIDPAAMFDVLFGTRADVVMRIFNAFVAGSCFHNVGNDQRARRILDSLRHRGLVDLLPDGKGRWAARHELEALLRRLAWGTLSVGEHAL